VHRKVAIEATEARNEVTFPRAVGFFGCGGPVIVGRNKLEVGIVVMHELFQSPWGFVVEPFKDPFEAASR
jgi:hypothetical protein